MQDSFYAPSETITLGFKFIGQNVLISRFARFYRIENIEIWSNVRNDDFCILSGKIKLDNNIHISAYSALYGRYGIEMNDFSGLSPRCIVFSASDDFSGDFLTGPKADSQFTNVTGGKVSIGKYSQLGSGCIVFPKIKIAEGDSVWPVSLVLSNLEPRKIYKGIPSVYYKERSKQLLGFV